MKVYNLSNDKFSLKYGKSLLVDSIYAQIGPSAKSVGQHQYLSIEWLDEQVILI